MFSWFPVQPVTPPANGTYCIMARTPTHRRAPSREASSAPINGFQPTQLGAGDALPTQNTATLFRYTDDKQPVFFFLEPQGIPKNLRISFEVAITVSAAALLHNLECGEL